LFADLSILLEVAARRITTIIFHENQYPVSDMVTAQSNNAIIFLFILYWLVRFDFKLEELLTSFRYHFFEYHFKNIAIIEAVPFAEQVSKYFFRV